MTFGEKMLALMAERNLSLRKLAELAHYDHGYLSKVSRDLCRPSAEVAERLDGTLGANGELKDLASEIRDTGKQPHTVDDEHENATSSNNLDEDGEEMERRTLLQALVALGVPVAVGLEALQPIRSGVDRAVGRNEDSHLDEWEQTVADYGHTYRFAAPRHLMLELAADLATVQVITSRSKKEKSKSYSSWCRVSGGLSLLMAKTLSNLNEPRLAREWWFTALHAAKTSGDRDLHLWIGAERLIHGLYEGRPTAILLREADKIIEETPDSPCRGLLGVRTTRAQLLSVDGAKSEAHAEIRACNAMFERLPASVTGPAGQRSVIAGWPESRTRYTEAWVYGYLGEPDEHDQAISRLRDVHPMDSPGYRAQVDLLEALGHVRSGDVTEGVRRAHDVYAGLSVNGHGVMVNGLATRVLESVPASESAKTTVSQYRELLAATADRKAIT